MSSCSSTVEPEVGIEQVLPRLDRAIETVDIDDREERGGTEVLAQPTCLLGQGDRHPDQRAGVRFSMDQDSIDVRNSGADSGLDTGGHDGDLLRLRRAQYRTDLDDLIQRPNEPHLGPSTRDVRP